MEERALTIKAVTNVLARLVLKASGVMKVGNNGNGSVILG